MASTARPAAPRTAPKPAPLGDGNFEISEADGIVTMRFRLGVDLGLSGSERRRIEAGDIRTMQVHTVSAGDPTWKASDGTRFSFTAYVKLPK